MTELEIFKTSISLMTRIKAEQFRRRQSHPHKAKQVYLNTLAVSAVNSYLNSMGWATNLEASDSWNPVLQTMMDVADLDILNYGKLECRVVLPNTDWVIIPPEVWFQRIAYIAVGLDESLTEANLLGFVTQIMEVKLPLNKLQPLSGLTGYLSQQRRGALGKKNPTSLSKWLKGISTPGWQQLEELLPQSIAVNFRSPQKMTSETGGNPLPGVSCVKLVDLEDPHHHNITLVLNISADKSEEFNISVKVCPSCSKRYLPQGLELLILDETKKPMMFAQANDTETIEFCFSGELGEYFDIEVSLDDYIKRETFVI